MGSRYHTIRLKKRTGKTRSMKVGAKTFKTEDAAKVWASAQGIKNYSLLNLKSPESSEKKIRVVSE